MQWICATQYDKFTIPLKVAIELLSSQGRYRGEINASLPSVLSKSAVSAQHSFIQARAGKTLAHDNITFYYRTNYT